MMLGLALAWAAILVGCGLGWQLLRQNGRILLRLDELEKRLDDFEFRDAGDANGLPLGGEAPAFELLDLAGDRKSLAQYRGQPVLLIFFNPACGFCRELLLKLASLPHPQPLSNPMGEGGQRPREGHPFTLVVSTGDAESNRQLFEEHKLACPVLLQKAMEVATAYQARGTPSGYSISPEGQIASELTVGSEALLELAAAKPKRRNPKSEIGQAAGNGDGCEQRFGGRSLTGSKIKRDGLKAGTAAPDFHLPRLDGRGDLSLEDLRGRLVLLVFSSPHCGPCNVFAPRLERFHREHPELEVVMISKGEPKENRAKVKEHGLTFPVVLQQQWEVSRRYAMFATPIAYVIDERGVIAHDVAGGSDAVVQLMTDMEQCTLHPVGG